MSRWSDRVDVVLVRAMLVRAVLVRAVLVGAVLVGASAWPDPSAAAEPTTPVDPMTLPVVDLLMGTADIDGAAEVRETTRGAAVRLDATLLFGKDNATLRPGARRRLAEVAAELRQRGAGRLQITGYTDDLGSAAHGLELSRQRARAVAAVLRTGLPAGSYPFVVRGRGEADPAVPNDSEAHRRQNRRVEVGFVRTG